ncbi:hypothetical protein BKK49_06245 [Rodentibacter rarus]|nr:hypothetical protein BKK49_06245 [Rodentibacter rarus]
MAFTCVLLRGFALKIEHLKHQGAPVLARRERLSKFALKSLQKACGRGEGLLAIFRPWVFV